MVAVVRGGCPASLGSAGDTPARGGHAEGDPAGQGRARRWYRRLWMCKGGSPSGHGGTRSSPARGIRVGGVLCVKTLRGGGHTRCGRVGDGPASHSCAASTPMGRAGGGPVGPGCMGRVLAGCGRAGKRSRQPRRNGKYFGAWWSRRRCSCESRLCVGVVTPIVLGFLVRVGKWPKRAICCQS